VAGDRRTGSFDLDGLRHGCSSRIANCENHSLRLPLSLQHYPADLTGCYGFCGWDGWLVSRSSVKSVSSESIAEARED
jgi:hypothetical protein